MAESSVQSRSHAFKRTQTVLTFLVIITSALQYIVQRLNYNRDLQRIEWIVEQARTSAWGSKMTPQEGQRKVSYFSWVRYTRNRGD